MEFSMNSPREHLQPGYGDGFLGALLSRRSGPIIPRLSGSAADRLGREYAYQVLLIDEFQRAGMGVIFLNRELGQSREDDLLLQVQGMMAAYERPKITERHRRGKKLSEKGQAWASRRIIT
jgi:hypothetical protein